MTGAGWGKVILLGEHAVVHGYPALAGALGQKVRVTARPAEATTVHCAAWGLDGAPPPPMAAAVAAIAARLGVEGGLALAVDAQVPARAGLGSSAAFAVACARALGPGLSVDEVVDVAGEAEQRFHGNPSGVDVALAARGGLGRFVRGEGLTPLAAAPVRLAIGLTGEPRDTAARVADVAARRERDPAGTDVLLAELGALVDAGIPALGDRAALGRLFAQAQTRLVELGLSSPGIERLITLAMGAGASGAKLTGAGGGGAVIAAADEPERVVAAWQAAGFSAFVADVGVRA